MLLHVVQQLVGYLGQHALRQHRELQTRVAIRRIAKKERMLRNGEMSVYKRTKGNELN